MLLAGTCGIVIFFGSIRGSGLAFFMRKPRTLQVDGE
jgi:hypothetical protein